LADGLGNTADNWVGDLDSEQALSWYGIYSFVMAAIGTFGWMTFNGNWWVSHFASWWVEHVKWYLPAGMAWWILRFFPDNEFVDTMMKMVVSLTIVGPFVNQWRALGSIISVADAGCYGYTNGNCDTLYSYLWFYLGLAIYSVSTIFEMIIQTTILPKVFDGIDQGDFDGLEYYIGSLM